MAMVEIVRQFDKVGILWQLLCPFELEMCPQKLVAVCIVVVEGIGRNGGQQAHGRVRIAPQNVRRLLQGRVGKGVARRATKDCHRDKEQE